MRQNAQAPEGSANQQAASSLRAPYLEDEAERLFEAYVETFQQAPESDFLIKQYFYSIYFEKQYLQDNVFFIPRENFLWFFKYYLDDKKDERTIELKKRSAERAEKEVEIATILIRRHCAYEEGAADIIYARTFAKRETEEYILKNTTDAVTQVEQLLEAFRRDRVIKQPY